MADFFTSIMSFASAFKGAFDKDETDRMFDSPDIGILGSPLPGGEDGGFPGDRQRDRGESPLNKRRGARLQFDLGTENFEDIDTSLTDVITQRITRRLHEGKAIRSEDFILEQLPAKPQFAPLLQDTTGIIGRRG